MKFIESFHFDFCEKAAERLDFNRTAHLTDVIGADRNVPGQTHDTQTKPLEISYVNFSHELFFIQSFSYKKYTVLSFLFTRLKKNRTINSRLFLTAARLLINGIMSQIWPQNL